MTHFVNPSEVEGELVPHHRGSDDAAARIFRSSASATST